MRSEHWRRLYDPGVADLVRTWESAKAAGDPEALAAAALALAATPTFGGVPGGVPALLFEARAWAEGAARTRLAAALARAWAYAGHPERAAGFAAEAQADAERQGDATLLADALDAQLAVHWGPDQLADRLRLTDRLEDTAAHLTEVEARLSAHLWRLSTGLETLDGAGVRRQLRALDLLAAESGSARVAFFAASRRGMHALLTGDLDTARAALREAGAAGRAADSADVEAVEHTLRAGIARQAGDTATLVAEAGGFEGFGLTEGIRSIAAWGAVLWVAAGRPDQARAVLHQLDDFTAVPRDLDWLLVMYLLTDVATAVGERAQAETGLDLLTPYAGRGVIDAGGVAFAGVVDDVLARACVLLDRSADAARWSASAQTAYRRMGATWFSDNLGAPPRAETGVAHLRPGADGIWWVGRDGETSAVRDMRGLHYLHMLLSRPGVDVSALALSVAVAGNSGTRAARAVDADTARWWTARPSRPTGADWPSSTTSWPRPEHTPTSAGRNVSTGSATRSSTRCGRPPGRADAPGSRAARTNAPASPSARPSPPPSTGSRRSIRRWADCSATPSRPAPPAATTRIPTARCAGCSEPRRQTPREAVPNAVTAAGSPSSSTRAASRPNPWRTNSPGSPVIVTDRSACLATIRSPVGRASTTPTGLPR